MAELVSIIIPLYNREKLVVETLDSVRAQTYPHWEAVVVDDRSTDGSAEAVRKIAAEDERVRLLVRPEGDRRGAPRCRNLGFEHSRGELVIFLDSDDLLAPECLKGRVGFMAEHPECDFAVFQAEYFFVSPGDMGVYWNAFTAESDLDRFLSIDAPWQTASPIWRRGAVEAVGGWDEEAVTWQDWEFHVRALAAGLQYEKNVSRDLWIRKGTPGAISGGDGVLGRNLSIAETACRLTEILREAGELNGQRSEWLRGVVLARLAKNTDDLRHLRAIGSAVRRARRVGLLGTAGALEARALYILETVSNWFIRRYRRRRFPEQFGVNSSLTRGKARVRQVAATDEPAKGSVAEAVLSEKA